MPTIEGGVIGTKLKEEDLAILNQKLAQDNFDSLSDMVKAYLKGLFSATETLIEEIAEKVVQRLTPDSVFRTGQARNTEVRLPEKMS
jgi:hypothetical protein